MLLNRLLFGKNHFFFNFELPSAPPAPLNTSSVRCSHHCSSSSHHQRVWGPLVASAHLSFPVARSSPAAGKALSPRPPLVFASCPLKMVVKASPMATTARIIGRRGWPCCPRCLALPRHRVQQHFTFQATSANSSRHGASPKSIL